MKDLSKEDIKVLGVLVDWGCNVRAIDEAYCGVPRFTYNYEGVDHLFFDVVRGQSVAEAVVLDLKMNGADVSKPNNELTDEEKGLIQLLFEIEKALEIKKELNPIAPTEKVAKVFLGGTCNESTWRDELIPLLEVDYFNPVVEDWNKEAQKEEERQKEECAAHLYVITSEMKGVYSIAEAVASANQEGVVSLFFVIPDGFDKAALRSLSASANLISNQSNGFGCVMHEANNETYFKVIAARLNEIEKALV